MLKYESESIYYLSTALKNIAPKIPKSAKLKIGLKIGQNWKSDKIRKNWQKFKKKPGKVKIGLIIGQKLKQIENGTKNWKIDKIKNWIEH